MKKLCSSILVIALVITVRAASVPVRSQKGIVASQNEIASKIGADAIKDGGTAVDAAVATAFALAVVHPTAGNIGGGGFMVYRPANGNAVTYDFREKAPAAASATMWLDEHGKYSAERHHNSYLAVGVPGTVAGLHLAWKEQGKLPWKRLVEPAIALARDGFVVSDNLSRSLKQVRPRMEAYPASIAQFTKNGAAYEPGDILKQPDLARTLQRIADHGPAGFYEGETAALVAKEMAAHGGLITADDLKHYQAARRAPVKGTYRGYEVVSMPPPSSGGVGLVEMLNVLEGYDLKALGFYSAAEIHLIAETMKRSYADRAHYLGDPDFVKTMPLERLMSKDYAADLRKTIDPNRAAKPSATTFDWPHESDETTHISIVDANRNALSMTYTLEQGYGVKIVVPGAGFLLNNEMGDFNAGPGLTNEQGLVGTEPNLAAPNKRMLSSMAPAILAKDGQLFMVTGSPGGRTIINTVLETILDVVDFGMNAQEAVDAPRFHHQWLPDRIDYEKFGFSPDTVKELQRRGQTLREGGGQGVAQVIVVDPKTKTLEGGSDRRAADGAAATVK
ncbi:MAG TPA: gamma-glutamyltransferase [Vicinamibacterales bacterium]|nr:gamma-glutamyltransferase [Vicinamibacterales bacterium]